jgi:hypothetical protein
MRINIHNNVGEAIKSLTDREKLFGSGIGEWRVLISHTEDKGFFQQSRADARWQYKQTSGNQTVGKNQTDIEV